MTSKYAKQRGDLLAELDGMRLEVDGARRTATLILDRPPLNIVSYKARSQIGALFEELGRDPEIGVIVAPSGNRISSCRPHPVFWKSLMRNASLRLRSDRLSRLCASRRAGA